MNKTIINALITTTFITGSAFLSLSASAKGDEAQQ